MPQSTLTTSSLSLLKNNLQSLYELQSFFFLLSIQLQLWIQTFYIETSFWLFLMTQLLQNTTLQMASGLWIQTVFFSLITKFTYHLLVISVHIFSSIIMTTFLLDTMVKTKYWNQFTMDISSPASMLIYSNSVSPMLLVYDPSHNITSPIDLLNNFLFPNDYEIPFLWTSSRNFYYPLGLILFRSQLTGSLSRQSLFQPIILLYPQTQYVCLFFMCFPKTVFLPMSPLTEAQSLCQTSSILQVLLLTCGFTSLQDTIPKVMDKLNAQIRLLRNTSIYIVITNKITSLNSYLSQSLSIIML